MRKIEEGIEIVASITQVAGATQVEVDLPGLGDRTAYMPRHIDYQIDPASALPTSLAAGLWLNDVVIVGEEQASPADLMLATRVLKWFSGSGQAAGAGAALSHLFFAQEHEIRSLLFRELYLIGLTVNLATFPTYSFNLVVDAYQLTTSEFVDLLG